METIIRIHAVCPFFEITQEVKESKSVARLTQIRKNFSSMKLKRGRKYEKQTGIFPKLSVSTSIVNPSIF